MASHLLSSTANSPSSTYSIPSAIKMIHRFLEDAKKSPSEIISTASLVLSLSLEAQIHRVTVLTTALMVERIVQYVVRHGTLDQRRALLSVLVDMKNYWQTAFPSTQPWKSHLNAIERQAEIHHIGADIAHLQQRLAQVAATLDINLNIQVLDAVEVKNQAEIDDDYHRDVIKTTEEDDKKP
ncbi:hypothetical protein AC1031_013987 [Aphanomyces cochlioides]|nr:hypothetical protein AC1031_013987 [Aphanomyces cochlioides]